MKKLTLCGIMAMASLSWAQTPNLVTDYMEGETSSITLYENIGIFNDDITLFPLITNDYGEELGTVKDGEIIMLKDLYEGDGDSKIANFVFKNGKAYFTARESATESGVWESDGTADGTKLVAAVSSSYAPSVMVQSKSGTLYFTIAGTLYQSSGDGFSEVQTGVYFDTDYNTRTKNYCLYEDEIAYLKSNDDYCDIYTVKDGKPVLLSSVLSVKGVNASRFWGMNEVENGLIFSRFHSFEADMKATLIYNKTTEEVSTLTINGTETLAKGIMGISGEKAIVWVEKVGYYAVNGVAGEEELLLSVTTSPSWGYEFKAIAQDGNAIFTVDYGMWDGGASLVFTDGTAGGTKTLCELEPYSANFALSNNYAFFATGTSNGFTPQIIMADISEGTSKTVYTASDDAGTNAIHLLGVQDDVLYFVSNLDSDIGDEMYSLDVSDKSGFSDGETSGTTATTGTTETIWTIGTTGTTGTTQTVATTNTTNATTATEANTQAVNTQSTTDGKIQDDDKEQLATGITYQHANTFCASPNPVQENVTIQFGEELSNIQITIVSSNGSAQKIVEAKHAEALELLIEGPAGVYYLHVVSDTKSAVLKLLKE